MPRAIAILSLLILAACASGPPSRFDDTELRLELRPMRDDQGVVAKNIEVRLVNPNPFHDAYARRWQFGSHCEIRAGGQVKVVGVDAEEGVLISYGFRAEQFEDNAVSCPSGALTFITVEEFREMAVERRKMRVLETDVDRRMDTVNRLLHGGRE